MTDVILYHISKTSPGVHETLINRGCVNPSTYKALLVDEIGSTLGLERTEVMSMEGMEAAYFSSVLSGVPCEVESRSSDALKEAFCFD